MKAFHGLISLSVKLKVTSLKRFPLLQSRFAALCVFYAQPYKIDRQNDNQQNNVYKQPRAVVIATNHALPPSKPQPHYLYADNYTKKQETKS